MKLGKWALSNIKHNHKKYAMYFFSLCFSVFTAYAFLGLVSNESVAFAFKSDTRYRGMLNSFGVIIGVFVFFFMLNANNSFIRARKKEISMYSLFGMSNGKIGKLLFLEMMMVGALALIVGVGFGIFFSKLTAMILIKMTIPDYAGQVAFGVSVKSILITAGIFFSFFCVLGLSGLRVINKFELVDLFKAEKASEGKRKGSWILLIISALFIGAGYYLAASPDPSTVVGATLIILALVIVGTYLFFMGGFPKVLNIIKKNKKMYYKAGNLVAVSSFAHRIRSIGTAMATIAVLSAVATTAIATGFTLYANTEKNAYEIIGYDMRFYGGQEKVMDKIYETLDKYGSQVKDEMTIQRYVAYPKIEKIELDSSTYLASYFGDGDYYFRVYSETEYNRFISISKAQVTSVDVGGKYNAVFISQNGMQDLGEKIIGKKVHFSDAEVTVTGSQNCNFVHSGAIYTLVLSDSMFNELQDSGDVMDSYDTGAVLDKVTVLNYSKPMSSELNAELNNVLSGSTSSYRLAYNDYSEGLMIFGLVRFIGFFMSAVVILMTASMLYFKQIMAAEEEQHLFRMLRKVGMDEGMQKKVITKRLLPVFFVPLAVGIVHSIFAMKSADTLVFDTMILSGDSYITVLGYSAVMYIAYAVVYAIFYLLTKSQYTKTIKG